MSFRFATLNALVVRDMKDARMVKSATREDHAGPYCAPAPNRAAMKLLDVRSSRMKPAFSNSTMLVR